MIEDDYFLVGKNDSGVTVKYNHENLLIEIPKSAGLNLNINFYVHIFEKGGKYYQRDFSINQMIACPDDELYSIYIYRIYKLERVDIGQWDGKKSIWGERLIIPKTIYFTMDHFGDLYRMISIRYSYHPNDNCYLISSLIKDDEHERFLAYLQQIGVFKKIYKQYPRSHGLMNLADENTIRERLVRIFDTYSAFVNPPIDSAAAIYCSFDDTGLFPLYLTYKGIRYIHVESAKDQFRMLWRKKNLEDHGNASHTFQELISKKGILDGTSDCCTKWFVSDRTATVRYDFSKPVSIVCFEKIVKNIPEHIVEQIISYSGAKKEDLTNCKTIILANSKWAFRPQLKEKWDQEIAHAKIYATMLDLFQKDNYSDGVIFKSHPMYMVALDKYIPGLKCVSRLVSVDLLNAIKEINIDKCLSVHTTSVEKMQSYVGEFISVGTDFVAYIDDMFAIAFIYSWVRGKIDAFGFANELSVVCEKKLRTYFDIKKINVENGAIINRDDGIEKGIYDMSFYFGVENEDTNLSDYQYVLIVEKKPFRDSIFKTIEESKVFIKCSERIKNIRDFEHNVRMDACGIDVNYILRRI